ncbi:MAG: hypothetical protein VX341_09670 [Bdellovibrionota bacterium]|nr:hypothetical protein [Bdellovibrionota bacterium]
MKKSIMTALMVMTLSSSVYSSSTTLSEQSEGSFFAETVSALAAEFHETARINQTRHKSLCFDLGSLAEKARGLAAYVQQSAFTNTMSLQTTNPNAENIDQSGKSSIGLGADITNLGQSINKSADDIESFCKATGQDVRFTLLDYLKNLEEASAKVAKNI